MLSERQLESLLEVFRERMQTVTDDYIKRMGQHLRDIGKLKPSDVNRLVQMQRLNYNMEQIKREIAKAALQSVEYVERVFREVAESDYKFAAEIFGEDHTPRIKDNPYLERILKAQAKVTQQELANLSRTSIVDDGYKNAVDVGVQIAQSGVSDYQSAIRSAMKSAATSGLRVQYPKSGITRRLDSAVRMNVLDGIRSLNQDILRQVGKEYGADGVEISAHALCAEDHLPYQGKQMSIKDFDHLQNTILDRPFGVWNCRHTWHYILLGISQPTYSDEELEQFKENSRAGVEIDGETRSRYQWTQEQRKIETAIRYQKDIANAAKASGDMVARREAQAVINALQERYKKVSEAAGLYEKPERMAVAGFHKVKTEDQLKNPFSTLKNERKNGILVVTDTRTGHASVKPNGESANAVIDVIGKKGGTSRYIYNDQGHVRYRVDNNDHGYPSEHTFVNGEHYHVAKWDGNTFVGYKKGADIPEALRKMCSDILKGGN